MINAYPLILYTVISYTYYHNISFISISMINYRKLLQQESNAQQELNEIEELIYENNSNTDFN